MTMNAADTIHLAEDLVERAGYGELKRAGLIPLHDLFFPSIYYPPLTRYPAAGADALFADLRLSPSDPACMYVHIPFCRSKCTYCHWVTCTPRGDEEIDRYLDYLDREAAMKAALFEGGRCSPTSVLVGGGTPSLLAPRHVHRLMEILGSRFDLAAVRQFSWEAEPASLNGPTGIEHLRILKEHGVHRLSLGVQSLDDEVLRAMGRPHTARDAALAVQNIRAAGIGSISIDLIYGYPGATVETWCRTLEQAHALDIDAYQLYRLRIVAHGDKAGTVQQNFRESPDAFPGVHAVHLMKAASLLLARERGFHEHFRRIFARGPEHISQYLWDYCCDLSDVAGLGVSAWSSLGGRLALNTGDGPGAYYRLLDEGRLPVDRGKVRTDDDERRRRCILPLKNSFVRREEFRRRTGLDVAEAFGERLELLRSFGLLDWDGERVFLTERGIFFADETVMQLYNPEYLPFPDEAYAPGVLNPHRK